MNKIFSILISIMISTTFASPAANAENFGKKVGKAFSKAHERHTDMVKGAVTPPLVHVDRGPRYYSDVVYYPRGDYRGRDRHQIVIDDHHRPYCRTHRHYDEWRYRDLRYGTRGTYSGLHFVIRLGDRWYCDRHARYDCDVLSQSYYSSYSSRYDEEVAGAEHSGGRPVVVHPSSVPVYHFGTGDRDRLSVDGGGYVTCRLHGSARCAIVIGILHGGTSYRYVGTRVLSQYGEHSAFCARGTHCE